jgi:hypothetical protein
MANLLAYAAVGLAAGVVSSLLGIGGGVVLVPILILVFAFPAHEATVTSLAYIAPVALAGALLGWHRGHQVHWGLVAVAVPTGLVGAYLGAWASHRLSTSQLKIVFGILMVVIGLRLATATLRSRGAPPAPPAASQPTPGGQTR